MGDFLQKFMKRFHPEGIPWPASILYNAISNIKIFHQHYELVAIDIAQYRNVRRLLDIGTGSGHLFMHLRKLLPEAELFGIDISPAMIAQARRNVKRYGNTRSVELQIACANALPFANGVFDCVVSTGSLHHWKDPVNALSEVYRILKPGGYALLYDLVRNMPRQIRKNILAKFGGFRLALLWLHSFEEPFLNIEEMETLGRQTHFIVEETRFTGTLCCLVLRKTVFINKS